MPTEKPRSPEEPAEGPRDTHELDRPENNRESGARKLEERPGYRRPDPIHTGDRGDEPPGSSRGDNPLESDDADDNRGDRLEREPRNPGA